MHIKFISRGTGKCSKAVGYIMSDTDSNSLNRAQAPKVLRGDPVSTAELADSLEFKHRYRSAVIAWHREDHPTDAQIQEVLNDFEKIAFAGLDKDQYDWIAVLHREENSEHIHIIVPRVELSTGKSFNPAPPGWQKSFDPLRDYFNAKYGWKSPDISLNPNIARITQPGLDALRGGTRAEIKKTIEEYLLNQIETGSIEDREDIIRSLKEIGFAIPRQGANYITIHDKDTDIKIRLKGAIYEQHWTTERTAETENSRAAQRDRSAAPTRVEELERKIEGRISSRCEYNQKRYSRRKPEVTESAGRAAKTEQKYTEIDIVETNSNHTANLADHLERELGSDAISIKQNSESVGADRAEPADTGSIEAGRRVDHVQPVRRKIVCADRPQQTGIQRRLQDFVGSIKRGIYDGIRAKIDGWITGFERTIQERNEHFKQASTGLEQTKQRTYQTIQPSGRTFERGIRKVRENRADELERFKVRINLVEYAASMGFQIDKKSSSANSKVLKSLAGEKIVITTDQDGHGIYFNVNDRTDSGSIIDFHQKCTGDNLGQTRKKLRQFGGFADVKDYKAYAKPKPVDKNISQVAHAYAGAELTDIHPYLVNERKISAKTLRDSRFRQSVKIDQRGNALFGHYNSGGICGYEIKNRDFVGFAKGGTKGVWYSANITRANCVVVVESGVDALSHAELKRTGQETAYISTAGSLSPAQLDLIKHLSDRHQVIIATDNDHAGDKYAEQILEVIPTAERELPPEGKDWNDVLKEVKKQEKSRGFVGGL